MFFFFIERENIKYRQTTPQKTESIKSKEKLSRKGSNTHITKISNDDDDGEWGKYLNKLQ